MLKIFFTTILAIFLSQISATVQICDGIHPNTQTKLAENRVKKITRWHTDQNGVERVISVHNLDSTGCAWRYVYYDRRWKQYKVREKYGHFGNGKTETYTGYFNEDSVEVMSTRETHYYDKDSGLQKEERYINGNKPRHFIINHRGNSPDIDRITYTLNFVGDTLSYEYWHRNTQKVIYVQKEKIKGEWKVIKNDSSISVRNERGDLVLKKDYQHGELTGGKKIELVYSGEKIVKTREFDLNGNLLLEAEGDDREMYIKEYENGKLVNTRVERLPVADPMPDPFNGPFLEEGEDLADILGITTSSKDDKKEKPDSPFINEEEKSRDTVILQYHRPPHDDKIKVKTLYSSAGLVLEIQLLFKNETNSFEYEFYDK